MCASPDSIGTQGGEPRCPEAGLWFDYQIKQLAKNAHIVPSPPPSEGWRSPRGGGGRTRAGARRPPTRSAAATASATTSAAPTSSRARAVRRCPLRAQLDVRREGRACLEPARRACLRRSLEHFFAQRLRRAATEACSVSVPCVCAQFSGLRTRGSRRTTAALPEVFLEHIFAPPTGANRAAQLLHDVLRRWTVLGGIVGLAAGIIVFLAIRRATRGERHRGKQRGRTADINTQASSRSACGEQKPSDGLEPDEGRG